MTKREAPIYKVIFLNQGQVFEMYAKQIYQSDLWGFLEVEEFVFWRAHTAGRRPGRGKTQRPSSKAWCAVLCRCIRSCVSMKSSAWHAEDQRSAWHEQCHAVSDADA